MSEMINNENNGSDTDARNGVVEPSPIQNQEVPSAPASEGITIENNTPANSLETKEPPKIDLVVQYGEETYNNPGQLMSIYNNLNDKIAYYDSIGQLDWLKATQAALSARHAELAGGDK